MLDKSTGKVTVVSTIPAGEPTITWSGSSLPTELQNALNSSSNTSSTTGTNTNTNTSSTPITSSAPQTNFNVNYDPTDINSMQTALTSLQQNAKTQADYDLLYKITQQLNTERSRQSALIAKANQLMSSASGSTAINNFYASLSPKDQPLVKSILGSNVISNYSAPTNTNVQQTTVTQSGINAGNLGPYAQSMSQQQIIDLQKGLMLAGYDIPALTAGTADYGYYGKQTFDAVAKWQKDNGVNAGTDAGYWGHLSQEKLASSGGWKAPTSVPKTSEIQTQINDLNAQLNALTTNGLTDTTQIIQDSSGNWVPNLNVVEVGADGTYTPKEDAPSDTTGGGSTSSTVTTGSPHWGLGENKTNEAKALTEVTRGGDVAALDKMIDKTFLGKLMNDPLKVALWVHAIAYGGYTTEDIVRDMKREELMVNGTEAEKAAAKSLSIINPTMTRSDYYASDEGKTALTNTTSLMPNVNADSFLDSDFFHYGLNIPDEVFKTLVPLLDVNSQEYKDAIAAVNGAFYDVANAKLQAASEQEKAIADYNYKTFQTQIAEKYGIILSDNADKAWSQLQTIGDTYNKGNLTGSGLEAEAVDKSLSAVQKSDAIERMTRANEEAEKKAGYYSKSGTSAQIAGLTAEERANWGLAASADIQQRFSLANLRTLYPNLTDAEVQAKHDEVLDENGNYRSTDQQNLYSGVAKNTAAERLNAETEVQETALAKEKEKFAAYDNTDPYTSTTTTTSTA